MMVMMMMIKIATSAPVLFSEMQKKEELRTLARKFSNIDFFSENFTIER